MPKIYCFMYWDMIPWANLREWSWQNVRFACNLNGTFPFGSTYFVRLPINMMHSESKFTQKFLGDYHKSKNLSQCPRFHIHFQNNDTVNTLSANMFANQITTPLRYIIPTLVFRIVARCPVLFSTFLFYSGHHAGTWVRRLQYNFLSTGSFVGIIELRKTYMVKRDGQ